MFGSGNPTPYDVPLIVLLVALAILSLIGAATTGSWSPTTANLVRRGAMLVAIAATAVVHIVTPTTNGIIGAGRVLFVWPAIALTVIGFLVWSWRVGHI
jgi:hypothetical protein